MTWRLNGTLHRVCCGIGDDVAVVTDVCLEGYQWAQSDSTFSTAQTKAFTGKTLVIPAGLSPGRYRYAVTYCAQNHLFDGELRFNVDLDGADLFQETQFEGGNRNGLDEIPFARMSCDVELDATPHLFEIWIGSNGGPPFAESLSIFETLQEIWRVS